MEKLIKDGNNDGKEQNEETTAMRPLVNVTFDDSVNTSEALLQPISKSSSKSSLCQISPNNSHNDDKRFSTEYKAEPVVSAAEMTPAVEWTQKHKEKQNMTLNKELVKMIVMGSKIRQILSSPTEKVQLDDLLFSHVKDGNVLEARVIFSLLKSEEYSKDCWYRSRDEKRRTLVHIAVDNKDVDMLTLLLSDEIFNQTVIIVPIGNCLYRAIQSNFVEGVKLLLPHQKEFEIKKNDEEFLEHTTPQLLAAYHDNYEILALLRKNKLAIEIPQPTVLQNMHSAWETSHYLQMVSQARSRHAYIMALSEDYDFDTFEYCITLIKELRNLAHVEHEFSQFYQGLVEDVEIFMCKLIDQIRSTSELSQTFEYDYSNDITRYQTLKYIYQTSPRSDPEAGIKESGIGTRLTMLETACEAHLLNFVTHHNAQLAIEHLTYRNTPFFRTGNNISFYVARFLLALIFPILCIFHVLAPKSLAGRLITYPCTSHDCRIMSEFCFVVFLVANISTKRGALEYLGAPASVFEVLICLWVLGKWLQEMQELHKRGFFKYMKDPWNHSDLWALTCFTFAFGFRIVDYVLYHQVPFALLPARSEWQMFEWRLVAEGFLAFAYIFVFLRLLGLTRVNRSLGPLQVSLTRMVIDVIQFLCIFGLIMFAFALALAELYWFYGTSQGKQIFCDSPRSNATAAPCTKGNPPFQGVWNSIYDLFWALFGQIDLNNLELSGKHLLNEYIGKGLLAVYHVVAILVLLNMLIAMMSKSYERTSENEEKEWKFQRTKMWIRILRKEIIKPPPMNLLPQLWDIAVALKPSNLKQCDWYDFKQFFKSDDGTTYRAINQRKARRVLVSRFKANVLCSNEK